MRLHAYLTKTTTDDLQSRVMSDKVSRIVLDCYMTPDEFAQLVGKYFNSTDGFDVYIVDRTKVSGAIIQNGENHV